MGGNTTEFDECASKDKGSDSHKLDQDVDRWSTRVLHRVTHCVTNNGSLVRIRVLPLHLTLYNQSASLDVLLGVVPGSS